MLQRLPGHMLVEARPLQGRKHQIRQHAAAALGLPVVGDARYPLGRPARKTAGMPRSPEGAHFLHAASLALPHPLTREVLQLEAPLPPHFEEALRDLEARHSGSSTVIGGPQ